jgi:hypothetical protein
MKKVKWLFLFSLAWTACSEPEPPKYIPNIEKIPSKNLTLIRLEKEIFQIDSNQTPAAVEALKSRYPNFGEIYTKIILSDGRSQDPAANLRSFITFSYARELNDTIAQKFKDLSPILKGIQEMNRYAQYYFPQTPTLDSIYTFFSVYNHGVALISGGAAIGLDFFLGPDHPGYASIPNLNHQYIRRRLTPEHILPNLAESWAQDLLANYPPIEGNRLIDHILRNGKTWYLMDKLLPHVPDSLKCGFSAYQMEYCIKGELALYEYLVKDINLYSDKLLDFRKYIEPGPFDPPAGRPGNSGSWLGLRMWQQYEAHLRKNAQGKDLQDIDRKILAQVLNETDPQKVLQRYKPRRR